MAGKQIDRVFQTEVDGKKIELKYDLFVPADYSEKDTFPLLLFLHGAGERGNDLSIVRKWGPPRLVKEKPKFPFIVVSPQCPKNKWWTSYPDALARLVDQIAGELKVNQQQMYCTGLSMGGYGSWALAAKHPNLFAAVAPICGGGDTESANRMVKIPIWVFHGDADRVVPVKKSQEMVDAVEAAGGKKIKFTVYKGVGHNSWSKAYANPKLYEWMLMQKRSNE